MEKQEAQIGAQRGNGKILPPPRVHAKRNRQTEELRVAGSTMELFSAAGLQLSGPNQQQLNRERISKLTIPELKAMVDEAGLPVSSGEVSRAELITQLKTLVEVTTWAMEEQEAQIEAQRGNGRIVPPPRISVKRPGEELGNEGTHEYFSAAGLQLTGPNRQQLNRERISMLTVPELKAMVDERGLPVSSDEVSWAVLIKQLESLEDVAKWGDGDPSVRV
jgi:hypothetical protein